jgi:hypothetical protein
MNRENLQKLADYLLSDKLQADFSMAQYYSLTSGPLSTNCGTVGCAIGHGPYAGIEKIQGETWGEYSDRVFVESTEDFLYMFGYSWRYVDNSPTGAAKRILFFLQNGLPDDWEEQMNGDAPLSYL